MVKPWQTLSSEQVLAERWINVRADRCLTESGKEIAPYYVLAYPDWVHVVALTETGELVLVEQYRHGAATTCLELPGGVIDPADPDPIAAARRELAEETGFAAANCQLISRLYPNPAIQANLAYTVLATGCRQVTAPSLEDGEDGMIVRCVPVADILAQIHDGVIGQSMHVAGLLLGLAKSGHISL